MKKRQANFSFLLLLGTGIIVSLVVVALSQDRNRQQSILSRKTNNDSNFQTACSPYDITGKLDPSSPLAVFEGEEIQIPRLVFDTTNSTAVLGVASEERWIEVDLSDQKIYAWEGETLYLTSAVSTGLPWWPTPEGEFRIWIKLRATKMEGGEGAYYYNLPNVPYVMFFENEDVPGYRGYGLHGAYWHNEFGTQRSHGCVNLPVDVAKQIYEWASPVVADGRSNQKSSSSNQGTRIVIHK